ncbi:PLxRFG domain-containing protein [Zooshikella marina]|uniref:PLxRFG domain-containing protein n=1 Tax=Zooshikella ganghwensis TaxID=202772 RepID=UPI001BB06111|nr:PLxRFG domain-containing protein [Zooshikella ganghwensis]MBU2708866.1 PLxRFG domain-containing protein [Zooshikella ganghwensis]
MSSNFDQQVDDYLLGSTNSLPDSYDNQLLDEDDKDDWQITRGLKGGWNQLQGLGGGLLALAGDAFNNEPMRQHGMKQYVSEMSRAQALRGDTPTFTNIGGVGDAVDWTLYTTGELLPTMAGAVISGGVGAPIGKKVVEESAKKLLKNKLSSEAIKQLGKTGARVGAALGAGGFSVGAETGSIYGETQDPEVSSAHGLLAGLFDTLPMMRVLDKIGLGGKAREEIGSSFLKGVAKQAGYEAATEGAQTLIEQHAKHWVDNNGQSILNNLDAVDWHEIIDASAAGALGGGLFGSAGQVTQKLLNRPSEAAQQAVDEAEAHGGDALDQAFAASTASGNAQPRRSLYDILNEFKPRSESTEQAQPQSEPRNLAEKLDAVLSQQKEQINNLAAETQPLSKNTTYYAEPSDIDTLGIDEAIQQQFTHKLPDERLLDEGHKHYLQRTQIAAQQRAAVPAFVKNAINEAGINPDRIEDTQLAKRLKNYAKKTKQLGFLNKKGNSLAGLANRLTSRGVLDSNEKPYTKESLLTALYNLVDQNPETTMAADSQFTTTDIPTTIDKAFTGEVLSQNEQSDLHYMLNAYPIDELVTNQRHVWPLEAAQLIDNSSIPLQAKDLADTDVELIESFYDAIEQQHDPESIESFVQAYETEQAADVAFNQGPTLKEKGNWQPQPVQPATQNEVDFSNYYDAQVGNHPVAQPFGRFNWPDKATLAVNELNIDAESLTAEDIELVEDFYEAYSSIPEEDLATVLDEHASEQAINALPKLKPKLKKQKETASGNSQTVLRDSQDVTQERHQTIEASATPATTSEKQQAIERTTDETTREDGDRALERVLSREVQPTQKPRRTGTESRTSRRSSRGSDIQTNQQRDGLSRGEAPSRERVHLSEPQRAGVKETPSNYRISDNDNLDEGGIKGLKSRVNNNLAAIKLLKSLGGKPATHEQQKVLAKYVGWGGLKSVFPKPNGAFAKSWEKQGLELRRLLTDEEYEAAQASILDAHYTAPTIIKAMYSGLMQLGFKGGVIAEPSIGVGNFFGLMPENIIKHSKLIGVELDNITGSIAKKLYPSAAISTPVAFQDFKAPDNSVDLIIGNPPFGGFQVSDKTRKHLHRERIHNYFIGKSIDLLKPGGLLSVVVSKGFMDSRFSQKLRKNLYNKAELLGAVRLPNNAFKKNANTEVTTDVLFFRKLNEGETNTGPDYRAIKQYPLEDGQNIPLNEYYHEHSDNLLGKWTLHKGRYGKATEPALISDGTDIKENLQKRILEILPEDIYQGEPINDSSLKTVQRDAVLEDTTLTEVNGLFFDNKGKLFRRLPGEHGLFHSEPVTSYANQQGKDIELKGKDIERLKQLVPLAQAARQLIHKQIEHTPDAELKVLRQALNEHYDQFVTDFGYVNRPYNKRLLLNTDLTISPLLLSLEKNYKSAVKGKRQESAEKSEIFSKRTQYPHQIADQANSAHAALVLSLVAKGKVDMPFMTKAYSKTEEEIIDELGDQLFESPDGEFLTKDQYLTGNIREKIKEAEKAVHNKPQLARNITALKSVLPESIDINEISVQMGAPWQRVQDITAFADYFTQGEFKGKISFEPISNKWHVENTRSRTASLVQVKDYETERVKFYKLLNSALNQKPITVTDTIYKVTTVNRAATEEARAKVKDIQSEFARWLWKDEQRADELKTIYNERFNSLKIGAFDGSHLPLPGINSAITLRKHQVNGIWRILQRPITLLDHVVGAGKTFTMIASGMEMRRIGLARKPLYAVPNHLVMQWAQDFAYLYPNSKVLVATEKQTSKHKRAQLLSQIATGDWDAVIIAHSALTRIKNDPEEEKAFLNEQVRDLDTSLKTLSDGDDKRTLRQMEERKKRIKEKLKNIVEDQNKDDHALNFKEIGIDALFVDEAHEYKNLEIITSLQNVRNIPSKGSDKAADLFLKIRSVLKRTGGRNLVFATGTPISNTMAELYNLQRYLGYDELKKAEITHFDAWARTFGKVDSLLERKPSGKFGEVRRFAKFVNLSELSGFYQQFADCITNDDITDDLIAQGKKIHIPPIKGGKPQNIIVPISVYQEGFMNEIIQRFENMPEDQTVDNRLLAANDARKSALDIRMIDAALPDVSNSKLNKAVEEMWRIYGDSTKDKGTQLVFCDLSIPQQHRQSERKKIQEIIRRADEGDENAITKLEKLSFDEISAVTSTFDAYNDIKDKLVAKGVPVDEIAFIHDAKTAEQKIELFRQVNAGEIRILLGSTSKMGAGTNVQERLVALHHIDAPWRPSDLEQREGRILRQGNQLYAKYDDFSVEIIRYATENTYDVNMWQIIEVKATFINQFRKAGINVRETEDINNEAVNAAEIKAAASGDPRLIRQIQLRKDIELLERLEYQYNKRFTFNQAQLQKLKKQAESLPNEIKTLKADLAYHQNYKGPRFVTHSNKVLDKDKDISHYFTLLVKELAPVKTTNKPVHVGKVAGFDFYLDKTRDFFEFWLERKGYYALQQINAKDLTPGGLYKRAINRIGKIETDFVSYEERQEQLPKDIKQIEKQLETPFDKQQELTDKRKEYQDLAAVLGSNQEANSHIVTLPGYNELQAKVHYFNMMSGGYSAEYLKKLAKGIRMKEVMDKVNHTPRGEEGPALEAAKEEITRIENLVFSSKLEEALPKKSISLSEAQEVAKGIKDKFKLHGNPNIRVELYESAEDYIKQHPHIPESAKQRIRKGKGFFGTAIHEGRKVQRVVGLSSAHASTEELQATYRHEITHIGLDTLSDAARKAIFERIKASYRHASIKTIYDDVSKLYKGEPDDVIAEEVITHIAQEKPSLFDNVLRPIKQLVIKLFRKLGLITVPLTKTETQDLIIRLFSRVAEGAEPHFHNTEIKQRRLGDAWQHIAQMDHEHIKRSKKRLMRNLRSVGEKARPSLLVTLGGRQIVDVYKNIFEQHEKGNPLAEYQSILQNKLALRSHWVGLADRIEVAWARLAKSKQDYANLTKLLFESTVAGVKPHIAYRSTINKSQLQKDIAALESIQRLTKIKPPKGWYKSKDSAQKALNHLLKEWKLENHRYLFKLEKNQFGYYYDINGVDEKVALFKGLIERDQQKKSAHQELHALYNELSQEAKQVYHDVNDYLSSQWLATKAALIKRAGELFEDTNLVAKLKAMLDAEFNTRGLNDGIYFPLTRFGRFIIIAKDPDGQYYREHHESLADFEDAKEKLAAAGFEVHGAGKMTDFSRRQLEGVSEFASKVYGLFNQSSLQEVDPKIREEFVDQLNQITLQMLPEVSAAKRSLHRRRIKGYSVNARRAFASAAFHGAYRLSRIEYGYQLQKRLNRMEKMIDPTKDVDPLIGSVKEDDRIVATAVFDEIEKRHQKIMNPDGHPLASKITNAAFTWYLGGSLGAGFVNLFQTALVALPILGGEFGYAKTNKAMAKATKDYFSYGFNKVSLHESLFTLSKARANNDIAADEISMIKELVDDATIDTTQASTLAQQADSQLMPEAQPITTTWTQTVRALGFFFHNAEVINREVTALAAFRLAKDSGKNFKDAVDIARKAVFDSHFDYSGSNRPRVMQNDWTKVFTIFLQYSQNMMYTLVKNFYDGFVSSNPNRKAEARKTLYGILGLHAMFAGVLGLPIIGILLSAISAAISDDDDPFDAETELRNLVADMFGQTASETLFKGIGNGLLGIDLHGRLGIADLFVSAPNYEMSVRDEFQHYLVTALGPAFGMTLQAASGVDAILDGNILKGSEKLVPKFIRDGLQMYRYASEGATTGGGDPVIETFTPFELAWKAVGMSPARLSEAYDARSSVKNHDKKISLRRSRLLREYYRARRDNDHEMLKDVQQKIRHFNRANPLNKIRSKQLTASYKGRVRADRNTINGIYLPDNKEYLRDLARFAN